MTSRQSDAPNAVSMPSSKTFEQYRQMIEKRWVECIRDTGVEDHRASKLPAGRNSGSDLLSIVCEAVASGGELSDAQMELIRARIRTKVYSISDLFKECVGLQTALDKCRHEVSPIQDPALETQLVKLHEALGSVSQSALRGTAEFLENVIEDCSTGFCQTDLRGRIVYLNDELQRIVGRTDLEGSLLEDLFEARERKTVKQAFVNSDQKITISQILHLVNSSGDLIPVGIELSVVCIRNEPVGGYAFITDLTRPIRLQNEIYDRFLLGIIQLDSDQRITYTNKSMRDMLGMEGMDWKGWMIDRIVPEEDMPILRSQLEKRWKGQSDEYEIHLRRQDDNRTVPVRISASPHKDRHGNVIGTMGIVHSTDSSLQPEFKLHGNIDKEVIDRKGALEIDREIISDLRDRCNRNIPNLQIGWEEELKGIGKNLFKELFEKNYKLRNALDKFMAKIDPEKQFKFRFKVGKNVHSLVLEALFEAQKDFFWMLRYPICRQIVFSGDYHELSIGRPDRRERINCLIINSDVHEYVQEIGRTFGQLLNIKREALFLEKLLRENEEPLQIGTITLIDVPHQDASFSDTIRQVLDQEKYHLVHYAGHSYYDAKKMKGYLILPGKDYPEVLDIEKFSAWLRKSKTQFIFLSSCHSSEEDFVFELASKKIPAILGFRWDLDDGRAYEYAQSFYRQLFEKRNRLEYALLEARKEMYDIDPQDRIWAAPMLVLQTSDR